MDNTGSGNQMGWPNVPSQVEKKVFIVPVDKKRHKRMEAAIEEAMKNAAKQSADASKSNPANPDNQEVNQDADESNVCPMCKKPMAQHPVVMGNIHEDCNGMPRPA